MRRRSDGIKQNPQRLYCENSNYNDIIKVTHEITSEATVFSSFLYLESRAAIQKVSVAVVMTRDFR